MVSTHKTSLLPLFDRVIVLHGGRVAFDGPREEAMARIVARAQAAQQSQPQTANLAKAVE
jgi:ATP-binding cassette subfamily C protein LapB